MIDRVYIANFGEGNAFAHRQGEQHRPDYRHRRRAYNWLDSVPLNEAIHELGMFGNKNTVCMPKTAKWRHTIDRLRAKFPNWQGS